MTAYGEEYFPASSYSTEPRPDWRPTLVPSVSPPPRGVPQANDDSYDSTEPFVGPLEPYVIARGDSLYRIAARELGNSSLWPLIADANGISDPAYITAGQRIRMPATDGVNVGSVQQRAGQYYAGLAESQRNSFEAAAQLSMYSNSDGLSPYIRMPDDAALNPLQLANRDYQRGLMTHGQPAESQSLKTLENYFGKVIRGEYALETFDRYNQLLAGAVAGDDMARQALTRGMLDTFAGAGITKIAGKVVAGEAGRFAALDARAVVGDKLTPHHMPQAAAEFTSRADGGALMLPEAEHMLTRTYGWKGAVTASEEAGMSFRSVLARDVQDVRSFSGATYNEGLRELLQYYRNNFPELMAKPPKQ